MATDDEDGADVHAPTARGSTAPGSTAPGSTAPGSTRTDGSHTASPHDQAGADEAEPTALDLAVRAVPGVARAVTMSALRAVEWSVRATRASVEYVAKRIDDEMPPGAVHDAAHELRVYANRALGRHEDDPQGATASELMRRGEQLLRRSNDVHVTEETHPAYARILTELSPDEARVLRHLYLDGPQPSLDVRTFRPLGIGSQLVAAHLSMVAERAGCRYVDRIDAYLTNLARLGLVEFPLEHVEDPQRYQVIEAQPRTVEAIKSAGRSAKLVQRSIRLTSFGHDFVHVCLPVHFRTVPERAARAARLSAERADLDAGAEDDQA